MCLTPRFDTGQSKFPKAQSGSSSFADTPRVCAPSTTWLTRNFATFPTQGFLAEADAIQAEAQRVSKCARHTQDLLLAADTRVISLYTDGSHSKPDDKCGLPDLDRWGFLALERPTAITLHEQYDRVHCNIADPEYYEADSSNNNTGELTAIG